MERKRPPITRKSITHHFEIHAKEEAVDGYITVGLYQDGTPAELFLTIAKAGEAIRGLARCWAIAMSVALQYGAPLGKLIGRFQYFRFEPAGYTDNDEIKLAHSIVDYVARWLEARFVKSDKSNNETGNRQSH